MVKLLSPNLHVDSIFEIDLVKLKGKGIESIIIDIDNTLVKWNEKLAPAEVIEWFEKVQKIGFKICLVSNSTRDRVVKFNENVNVLAIHRANKPRKKPFMKAINLLNTQSSKTAVIGDQIFTDILGGNRIGAYTILVNPISSKEFIWTRLVRIVEKKLLNKSKVVNK